jgi:hypothetical protein
MSDHFKFINSACLTPVDNAMTTQIYSIGLGDFLQASISNTRSLSFSQRTRPFDSLGFLTLRMGESSSHCHSLTATGEGMA